MALVNANLRDHFGRLNLMTRLVYSLILCAIIALALTSCNSQTTAIYTQQPILIDGMELYFGIVPAEILLNHPSVHEEQTMHGGVLREFGAHHLVISLFDASTKTRITDAIVTGKVTARGMTTQQKELVIMSFDGALSYGNYFTMMYEGPYDIIVNVQRPGNSKQSEARFQYGHFR